MTMVPCDEDHEHELVFQAAVYLCGEHGVDKVLTVEDPIDMSDEQWEAVQRAMRELAVSLADM